MKKSYIMALFLAGAAQGLFVWSGCGDDDDNGIVDSQNSPPVIVSLTADPDTFVVDHMSTIVVTAEDPDQDVLQYAWELDGDGFTAIPGATDTVRVTNCCPIYVPRSAWVHSTVTDGRGGEASDSIRVWVIPASNPL